MRNKERTSANKRDDDLESILQLLNTVLEDDEQDLTQGFKEPQFPVLFIVGNARSGTTLLYQWLASTGLFAYPSNLVSRFYKAPYIGALIHKMFVDYDKFGEILGNAELTFDSKLGKTTGAISPHEFWYFWRRFFKFGEIQKLSEDELATVDSQTFLRELAALERAFDKPLLLKGMILNWNISYLKEVIPNALFLHLKRDEIHNMHSLFKARRKYFGDVKKWYSFKPPEYPILKNKSVYEQLAGQVIYTNKFLETQSKNFSQDWISVGYDEFCKTPENLYSRVQQRLNDLGLNLIKKYDGPSEFEARNYITDNRFELSEAQKAIDLIKSIDHIDN